MFSNMAHVRHFEFKDMNFNQIIFTITASLESDLV